MAGVASVTALSISSYTHARVEDYKGGACHGCHGCHAAAAQKAVPGRVLPERGAGRVTPQRNTKIVIARHWGLDKKNGDNG